MRALVCVDMATDMLPQETLVGERPVAEGAGEGGVGGGRCLAMEVVAEFGVVGEQSTADGTSDHLFLGVASDVVL